MTTTKTKPKPKTKPKTKTKTKLAPIVFDDDPPKATKAKLDLDSLTASPSEMAYILGLNTSNITACIQQGHMTKDADGRLNVRDSVSSYCKRMRERKGGKSSANNLDDQLKFWKAQKLKEQVRSWRVSRDREIALAILQQLRNPLQSLRERLRLVPNVGEELDALESAIDGVDIETALDIVEGEDEGGDDD